MKVSDIQTILQPYRERYATLTALVEQQLSAKRFQHSLGVAALATHMGKKWGEQAEVCYIAGICHDIAKEMPPEEQLAFLNKSGFCTDLDLMQNQALWHAPVGALYLKQLADIHQEITAEVVGACLWHTIGKPQMTNLEAIIFLSDIIEPNRSWEGVEALREASEHSLNQGVALALKRNLEWLMKQGKKIHPQAMDAYEYYKNLQ